MGTYWRGEEPVEAFKWTADADQAEDPAWAKRCARGDTLRMLNEGTPWVTMLVRTPQGTQMARRGDWIILDRRGELSVASDRRFWRHYCAAPGRQRLRLVS